MDFVAVTGQILMAVQRPPKHSDGRAYHDKKIAEGRAIKTRPSPLNQTADSDAVYAPPPGRRPPGRSSQGNGPAGQPGNDSDSSADRQPTRTASLAASSSPRLPGAVRNQPSSVDFGADRVVGEDCRPATAAGKRWDRPADQAPPTFVAVCQVMYEPLPLCQAGRGPAR
jgi:hypothetical protein